MCICMSCVVYTRSCAHAQDPPAHARVTRTESIVREFWLVDAVANDGYRPTRPFTRALVAAFTERSGAFCRRAPLDVSAAAFNRPPGGVRLPVAARLYEKYGSVLDGWRRARRASLRPCRKLSGQYVRVDCPGPHENHAGARVPIVFFPPQLVWSCTFRKKRSGSMRVVVAGEEVTYVLCSECVDPNLTDRRPFSYRKFFFLFFFLVLD